MNATVSPINTTLIKEVVEFIRNFRFLEKLPLKEGHNQLRGALAGKTDAGTIEHICDHWRWKKRNFGDFWGNLDHTVQLHILKAWCFQVEGAEPYLRKIAQDPQSAMFLVPPFFLKTVNNVIMFFSNHGIHDSTAEMIDLPAVPTEKEKQYGNSSNWADYIFSFGPAMGRERDEVLTNIIEHYPKNRLTNQ